MNKKSRTSFRDFRSWIDKQNLKFVERQKKAKEKLLSQREKVMT